MTNRKILLHGCAVFLAAFLFIFACWVGLPADFNSDHITTNVRGADATSYGELLQLTLDPRTPAWFYPSTVYMEYLRPLQFMWMKFYFDRFGSSLVPFHVTAAIGTGFLSAVFFGLIYVWTGSFLLGWLAAFLYMSFPSNFFTLISTFSGDFQPYLSVMIITALLVFSRLTFGRFKSWPAFLLGMLVWITPIWLSIKIKSSEKIIPFICLAFLIWRYGEIRKRISTARIGALILAIAGMMVLVVPTGSFKDWVPEDRRSSFTEAPAETGAKELTGKDKQTFSFQWKNMLQRSFFVEGEDFSLIAPYREETPKSFTGNYGFFLGWLFWIAILLTVGWLSRLQLLGPPGNSKVSDQLINDLWILFIWFAATIAGFANGLSVHDTRFLNFAYVPSILLLFTITGIGLRMLSSEKKRRIFLAVLTAMVLCTGFQNYGFYSKLLMHYGGMQAALVRAETDVYQAVNGKTAHGWELYRSHPDLERQKMVIDWYELPADWLETAKEKLAKEGEIYFYTRSEDSERLKKLREAGLNAELWKRYNFVDAEPLAFRLAKTIQNLKLKIRGKAKRHEILIYRIPASRIAS